MRHDRSLEYAAREAATAALPPHGGWRWGLIGLWLVACAWLLAGRAAEIVSLSLPDSDDDLRLLQVRGWLAGQSWFDLRQYRLDPPAGADIHWSRLVDLPLAAIVRPLTPLFGAATAETIAVTIVPLLTLLAAMAVLAAIARRTIAPGAWWWAPLLLLMASPAVAMMAPLRIDHHGWQIVAVLGLVFGLVVEGRRAGGIAAGVSIAASLAIGVEMLPYLALGAGLAALGWVADARESERLRALCLAAGLGTLTALFAFIPPAQRFGMACDTLSVAYALPLLAGCAALFVATRAAPEFLRSPSGEGPGAGMGALNERQYMWRAPTPTSSWRGRAGWLLAAGAAAAVPLLVAGGGVCLIDPYHAVDPAARALWLDRVSEALPLWQQPAETAWASLALPLIGLAGAVTMLLRAGAGDRRGWIMILGVSALSILLALLSTRAAVAAQVLALPGAAALGFLGRARLAANRVMLVRVFGSVLLFLLVSAILPRLLIAAALAEPETKAEVAADAGAAACMAPRALAALDALPPATMFGFIDATPALLLHSHHKGIAGPYHRNGAAIADTMRAWAGTPAAAETIVRRHAAVYVIACGDPAEGQLYDRRAPDGFHARLMRGATPGWLAPVKVTNTPWRVWRVRQPLPGSGRAA